VRENLPVTKTVWEQRSVAIVVEEFSNLLPVLQDAFTSVYRNSLKRHFRLGSRLQTALSGLRMPGRELDNILDVTRERDRTAQQGIFQQFSISSCRKASMQLVAARKLELQRSCGFEYSERSGG